jgi:hypothetical protein
MPLLPAAETPASFFRARSIFSRLTTPKFLIYYRLEVG